MLERASMREFKPGRRAELGWKSEVAALGDEQAVYRLPTRQEVLCHRTTGNSFEQAKY